MNDNSHNHEQIENNETFSYVPPSAPLKHSGLGIASFILSLVSLVSFVVLTVVIGVLISKAIDLSSFVDENNNRIMTDQEIADKIQPLIGYFIVYPLILILEVISLILGIVALARKGYKMVFAVIGTVLSGLALLSVFLLIVIGFLAL